MFQFLLKSACVAIKPLDVALYTLHKESRPVCNKYEGSKPLVYSRN